jgi:hypothetical protein
MTEAEKAAVVRKLHLRYMLQMKHVWWALSIIISRILHSEARATDHIPLTGVPGIIGESIDWIRIPRP